MVDASCDGVNFDALGMAVQDPNLNVLPQAVDDLRVALTLPTVPDGRVFPLRQIHGGRAPQPVLLLRQTREEHSSDEAVRICEQIRKF